MSGLPREIERKYIIARPSPEELAAIAGIDRTEIVQTYLNFGQNGATRRIRKRGTAEKGYTYTYTEKNRVAFGECIEIETEISLSDYERLLPEALSDRTPVEKERYVFTYEGQVFELDVYPFSDEYASLEIELDDINTPVKLPAFLKVLKDVTGDMNYSNSNLAKTRSITL